MTRMRYRRLTCEQVVERFLAGMDPVYIACRREGPPALGGCLAWVAGPEGQAALQRVYAVLRREMRRRDAPGTHARTR